MIIVQKQLNSTSANYKMMLKLKYNQKLYGLIFYSCLKKEGGFTWNWFTVRVVRLNIHLFQSFWKVKI